MLDPQKALILKRLEDGLEQIAGIRGRGLDAHHQDFQRWKGRVGQGLVFLFGETHEYTIRFRVLSFWSRQMAPLGGPAWPSRDQARFERDLARAEQVLSDAIEELDAMSSGAGASDNQVVAGKERTPIDLFVSHSSIDSVVAETIVELLRSALAIPADRIRCTSVDGYRLRAGASASEQFRQKIFVEWPRSPSSRAYPPAL